MLPTEQAREKAREILETLRGKANERGLTDQEQVLYRPVVARIVLRRRASSSPWAPPLERGSNAKKSCHYMPDKGQFAELVRHVHAVADDEFVGAIEAGEVAGDVGGEVAGFVRAARSS